MSHIPKKAQRLIDQANKQRVENFNNKEIATRMLPTPRVMALGLTPRATMNLYDVYFNGEKQHLCTLANVDKGLVRRWSEGSRAGVPAKGAVQEELYGKVEIRRKPL